MNVNVVLLPNGQRILLHVIRLSFWFASFWAVAGVIWRPPLASIGLVCIFLVLLVAIEWGSRRLTAKRLPKIETAEPMDETVRQQIIRSKTPEGVDRLEGTFWAEFPPDATTATVHIPFCPAFERIPNVQALPVSETDALLRIVSPKAYGVRIDVKRSNLEIDQLCFEIIAEA